MKLRPSLPLRYIVFGKQHPARLRAQTRRRSVGRLSVGRLSVGDVGPTTNGPPPASPAAGRPQESISSAASAELDAADSDDEDAANKTTTKPNEGAPPAPDAAQPQHGRRQSTRARAPSCADDILPWKKDGLAKEKPRALALSGCVVLLITALKVAYTASLPCAPLEPARNWPTKTRVLGTLCVSSRARARFLSRSVRFH